MGRYINVLLFIITLPAFEDCQRPIRRSRPNLSTLDSSALSPPDRVRTFGPARTYLTQTHPDMPGSHPQKMATPGCSQPTLYRSDTSLPLPRAQDNILAMQMLPLLLTSA